MLQIDAGVWGSCCEWFFICTYVLKWDISEGYMCMGAFFMKSAILLLILGGWYENRGDMGVSSYSIHLLKNIEMFMNIFS